MNINWDKHIETPKFLQEIYNDIERGVEMDLRVGDRVRVLWVEEMLELNAEVDSDEWGEWVQFYDGDDRPIHDAMFPIHEELYQELEGKIFTIADISRDGEIDLLEDYNIGYAVTKEMVEKVR